MAKRVVDDSSLVAIGDAIRAKTGTSDPISFPNGMVEAISGITTGGVELPEDVHQVTFMDGDEVLYVRSVADGDNCADPVQRDLIDAPTKASTAQYEYTYSGWSLTSGGSASSAALTAVTEDRTVYAAYTSAVRYYTITYYDADGETVLKTEQLVYGAMPSYTPEKDNAIFEGWTEPLATVTGDASYIAQWLEAISGKCGTNATWMLDADTGVMTISGTGGTYSYSSTTYTNSSFYPYRGEIKKVVIGEGITSIGSYLFRGGNFTEIVLPSTITFLGEACFYSCKFTSIIIPEGVTQINKWNFHQCAYLETIVFPQSLVKFVDSAFSGCNALKTITIPANVNYIAPSIFSSCPNLTSVVFENPNGWWVATDASATSGTAVDVSDPATAATRLKTTYKSHYWKRS